MRGSKPQEGLQKSLRRGKLRGVTEFGRFMERVGAKLQDVAEATGLNISTVSRLRSGVIKHPRSDVIVRLIAWSDEAARRHGLPPGERLDWAHLNQVPKSQGDAA